MRTSSWIRQLFTRPAPRTIRKAPHPFRPALEALEDRWVPSTIVVNNPTDTPVAGQTDLRQAIALANTNGGDETITFDPTVFATPQTITLGGTQLELSDTTGTETITGPAAGVTISGNFASRVFQVVPNVSASISGLTIADGSSANGAGLINGGTLTMTNCTVSGNFSNYSTGGGAGLSNSGTLTMTNCTVSGNFDYNNGGLSNSGTLTLTNCTVSGKVPYSGG